MAGEYVYAEAARLVPSRAKRRKFRNLRLHLLAFQAHTASIGLVVVETAASVSPLLWGL